MDDRCLLPDRFCRLASVNLQTDLDYQTRLRQYDGSRNQSSQVPLHHIHDCVSATHSYAIHVRLHIEVDLGLHTGQKENVLHKHDALLQLVLFVGHLADHLLSADASSQLQAREAGRLRPGGGLWRRDGD